MNFPESEDFPNPMRTSIDNAAPLPNSHDVAGSRERKTRSTRLRRWARRSVLLVAAIAIGLYFAKILHVNLREIDYWFIPLPATHGDWQPKDLPFEEVTFVSADGTPLVGWFVPCASPRAVVLYCHGSGGNLSYDAPLLRRLHQRNVAVFTFDYRGFGKSGGRVDSEEDLHADARAARGWLARRLGLPEAQIVLMGRSLGGAVAIELAAKEGARGLVIDGTFTSLPEVSAHHYWWAPLQFLMRIRLDSAAKIGDYRGPLLQSHSDADDVVPYRLAQRLHALSNANPKQFVTFHGLNHESDTPSDYFDVLDTFLTDLP